MDDIYSERSSHDFADGVAAGIILGKHFGDSATSGGAGEDDLSANNAEAWGGMAPPRKGLAGVITGIVIVGTALYIVAMVVALVICAFE